VNSRELDKLLADVRLRRVSPRRAAEALKGLPYEDLGFAKVDHHRALRKGFPEVVFGAGKTPAQVVAIVERLAARSPNVLVTRATPDIHRALAAALPGVRHHAAAGCVTLSRARPERLAGRVAVVCAGTSDVPVAEEAAVTAELHGARVDRIFDVGVSGIHRLLDRAPTLRAAHVVVVAAGMEGALPSVVGGLVEAPVIAVPTSIGYGASFQGLAALLAMLNSCASGLAVVNIDNGFGAGYMACTILRTSARTAGRSRKKHR
jgi:pyridinium-3,5-biscarboxylic acid mononucleotide synthase